MKTPILILLATCMAATAQTNTCITFTNKSGDVISNAEVVEVHVSKLTYRIPSGGGMVKLADLPPQLQERFGYDAAKADAADKKEREDRAAELQKATAISAAMAKYDGLKNQLIQGSRRVDGKVLQKISVGLLVESGDFGRSFKEYHEDVYGTRGGIMTEGSSPGAEALNLVLLQDYPDSSMADDGHVDIIAYPVGLYTYESVGKSQKTVRKFSCNLDTAIRTLALDGNN